MEATTRIHTGAEDDMDGTRAFLTFTLAGLLGTTACGLMGSGGSSHEATDHQKPAQQARPAEGPPKSGRVELNTASRGDLAGLPGLTNADADRIIAGRPYKNKNALLKKQVLGEKKFDGIKDSVYVEHESN